MTKWGASPRTSGTHDWGISEEIKYRFGCDFVSCIHSTQKPIDKTFSMLHYKESLNAIVIVPKNDISKGMSIMREFHRISEEEGEPLNFGILLAEELRQNEVMEKLLTVTRDGFVPVVSIFTQSYLEQPDLLFWTYYLRVYSMHWTGNWLFCQFLIPVYADPNIRRYNWLFKDIACLLWYRHHSDGSIVREVRNRQRLQRTVAYYCRLNVPPFTAFQSQENSARSPCLLNSSSMQAAISKGDLEYVAGNIHTFDECIEKGCPHVDEIIQSVFHCNFPEAVQCLFLEGWPFDLDRELTQAIFEDRTEMVEMLCQLGAYPKGSVAWAVDDDAFRTAILMEHNILQPRLCFYCCYQGFQMDTFYIRIHLESDSLISAENSTAGNILRLTQLLQRNGCRIWYQGEMLKVILNIAGPRVKEVLYAALQPASLGALCRKTIREAMPGRGYKTRVNELGLPKLIVDYLCST